MESDQSPNNNVLRCALFKKNLIFRLYEFFVLYFELILCLLLFCFIYFQFLKLLPWSNGQMCMLCIAPTEIAHRRTYFVWRYYWSNLDPFFLCLQGKHAQNAVEGQRQLLCQSVKRNSQAGAIGLKAIAHWSKCPTCTPQYRSRTIKIRGF